MSRADWDMTPYFPEFDGDAYRAFRAALDTDVAALGERLAVLAPLEQPSLGDYATLLLELEDANARSAHLGSYLGCLGAADSRNEAVQRETASAAAARAALAKLFVHARAALCEAPEPVFEALLADERLAPVRYFLSRLREEGRRRMDAPLEALVADLDVTGQGAWGRLYDQVSGRLEFDLEVDGQETRRLPVSMTRSLLEDPRPEVRSAALIGANRAWEGVADVVAASLNAIAGTRLSLYERRGIDHFLDPALFDAGITRRTLDTLFEVVATRQEVARRYLREKATLLGRERLGFQDLMAPLPLEDPERISYAGACERVQGAFDRFYPDLGAFAADAFARRWIDWSPRAGKRPGGFCSTSPLIGESRIFLTYGETLGDLSTLAHELGHAYHGALMRDMRPWSRRYPMTLAETASTFAEQVVIDSVLEDEAAPAEARAVVLDGRLQDAAAFLLDIPMRFQFEHAFYEERAAGEVPVSRLKELMLEAQERCFGDALAPDERNPWFWASKLHFYITGLSFYNFPYTFGYLFSMGLFARAKREGAAFRPRYEALLRRTGSASAEEVARESLGVELEEPAFWNESIDLIEEDLRRFEDSVMPRFRSAP